MKKLIIIITALTGVASLHANPGLLDFVDDTVGYHGGYNRDYYNRNYYDGDYYDRGYYGHRHHYDY